MLSAPEVLGPEKYDKSCDMCRTVCCVVLSAPEVLGPEKYDKSCDMWSLGVIMYIL